MDHVFTLIDSDGESHEYTVTQHGGAEGGSLARYVGALLVQPFITGLGPMLPTIIESAGGLDAAMSAGADGLLSAVMDSTEAMESVDLMALSKGVQAALTGLPDSKLYQILKYTNRDGKPLTKGGKASRTYNKGYARNYTELARAIYEVCQYNGFFPGIGTSDSDNEKDKEQEQGQVENDN